MYGLGRWGSYVRLCINLWIVNEYRNTTNENNNQNQSNGNNNVQAKWSCQYKRRASAETFSIHKIKFRKEKLKFFQYKTEMTQHSCLTGKICILFLHLKKRTTFSKGNTDNNILWHSMCIIYHPLLSIKCFYQKHHTQKDVTRTIPRKYHNTLQWQCRQFQFIIIILSAGLCLCFKSAYGLTHYITYKETTVTQ